MRSSVYRRADQGLNLNAVSPEIKQAFERGTTDGKSIVVVLSKTAGQGGKGWDLHDDRWSVWRPERATATRTGTEVKVAQLKTELANRIRGRYNLSKAFYLTAETDIGGFGIGSDMAWRGYAALGCQITPTCIRRWITGLCTVTIPTVKPWALTDESKRSRIN
jgi:hypothetical protein